jgi:type IV pilus assembly protein PilW
MINFFKNAPYKNRGFSLIELMIAITLGALVVAATIGIFSTNRQTYVAAENVGRVQENARTAFEIMSRDIREAAGNACDKDVTIAVVLNGTGTNWWDNWNNPVFGFENGTGASAAGTDAIQLMSGSASTYTVSGHNANSAVISLNTSNHDLLANDILMICDQNRASIFQMSGPSATNATIVHNTGSGSPGNCGKGLGIPVCAPPQGTLYTYPANSQVSRLSASRWYVGDNGRGGRSLFRLLLRNNGSAAPEEIAEGVRDMQITYLVNGVNQYLAADAVTAAQWPAVKAVRLTFTIEGTERIGTDGNRIFRTISNTVTLRNRNQ